MSALALPLSLTLTGLLWYNDTRTHPRLSVGLWVVVFWVLRLSSRSIVYWINPEVMTGLSTDFSSGTPLERAFLTALMGLALLILLQRRVRWRGILEAHWALVGLFALMLLSTSWSRFPTISLKRWFRSAGDVLMMLVLLTEEDQRASFLAVFRRCAYLFLPLSVVFIRYMRHLGVYYTWDGALEMWVGVSEGKNGLGQLCCVSAVVLLSDLTDRSSSRPPRVATLLMLALALYLLNGSPTSRSSTSVGALLAGVALFVLVGRARNARHAIAATVALSGMVAVVVVYLAPLLFGQSLLEFVTGLFGREATLTGRVPLWNYLIELNRSSRWLGHGFGGFWLGDLAHDLESRFVWRPSSGHNGFLDVYLDLGFVGLGVLLLVLIGGYRSVNRWMEIDFPIYRLRLALYGIVIVFNLTESALVRPTTYIWMVFLSVIADPPPGARPSVQPAVTAEPVNSAAAATLQASNR